MTLSEINYKKCYTVTVIMESGLEEPFLTVTELATLGGVVLLLVCQIPLLIALSKLQKGKSMALNKEIY